MRRRLLVACLLVTTTGSANSALSVSHAAGVGPSRVPCALVLGDSIAVGMRDWLREYRVQTDGWVGRQWQAGVAEAARLRTLGALPPRVAIELGTNGPIGANGMAAMRRVLHGHAVLYVTNSAARPWIAGNNGLIEHQRAVLRWDLMARQHPRWLSPDGVHPTSVGAAHLAYAVSNALGCTR